MSLILDTGAVYAWYDRDDRWHGRMRELLGAEPGALILLDIVIPEVDHLLGTAIGQHAQLGFYEDLVSGAYLVANLDERVYPRVLDLNRRYEEFGLGFVDAAVMASAEILGIGRVATTDRRDFGAVRLEISLDLLP
jgi:uncharacterized protein